MAYMLRTRFTDQEQWHPAQAYKRKRDRDKDEMYARVMAGVRTHTWRETKKEEAERLERYGPGENEQ